MWYTYTYVYVRTYIHTYMCSDCMHMPHEWVSAADLLSVFELILGVGRGDGLVTVITVRLH